ncbi:hypothetical protein MFAL_39210 [Mycolicibacterium fallax]|nr:hypothetical protein MFAL_39210 [Mycolicibacterium fallax]
MADVPGSSAGPAASPLRAGRWSGFPAGVFPAGVFPAGMGPPSQCGLGVPRLTGDNARRSPMVSAVVDDVIEAAPQPGCRVLRAASGRTRLP